MTLLTIRSLYRWDLHDLVIVTPDVPVLSKGGNILQFNEVRVIMKLPTARIFVMKFQRPKILL